MMNSVILDVAIGMAFLYLLLSLIASVVQEVLAGVYATAPREPGARAAKPALRKFDWSGTWFGGQHLYAWAGAWSLPGSGS